MPSHVSVLQSQPLGHRLSLAKNAILRLALIDRNLEAHDSTEDVLLVAPEPGPQWCKPDLFVRVAVGEFEDHWFIEIDRATQSGAVLERKATVYASYWRAGVRDPFPLVLFTVPDERRRRFVADVLGRLPGELRPLFRVALFEDAVRLISAAGAAP